MILGFAIAARMVAEEAYVAAVELVRPVKRGL